MFFYMKDTLIYLCLYFFSVVNWKKAQPESWGLVSFGGLTEDVGASLEAPW